MPQAGKTINLEDLAVICGVHFATIDILADKEPLLAISK